MYKYKIGYSTWEESSYVELEHVEKFSHDQMTMMIAEAVKELFDEITGKNDEKDDIGKQYYHVFSTKFQNFWDGDKNIVDWLVSKKGFSKIEYELAWWVDGWDKVLDPKKENCFATTGNLTKISDYLKKEGISL